MDAVHVHLFLNHVPLTSLFIGIVILAWGIFAGKDTLRNAGALIFVFSALIALIVFTTGLATQDSMKTVLEEHIISTHLLSAKISLGLILTLGVMSVSGFFLKKAGNVITLYYFPFVLVFSVIVLVSFLRTSSMGGQIRHTELRKESPGSIEVKMEEERPGVAE